MLMLALALAVPVVAPYAAAENPTNVHAPAAEEAPRPRLFVPVDDLGAVVAGRRAVLLERETYERLHARAARNAPDAGAIEAGQVTRATYRGRLEGDAFHFEGELALSSLHHRPLAVPLPFGRLGLTRLRLGGEPAPLRPGGGPAPLTLVLPPGLHHTLEVAGTAPTHELETGGTRLALALPTAAAGTFTLVLPGDQEVVSNVPLKSRVYDPVEDATEAQLTIGGRGLIDVALLGNGHREDARAVLVGESATTVTLTPSGQRLACLYTVQVLRRGVRDFTFLLDPGWTVTDVASPDLVRWSAGEAAGRQRLTVRLRTASRGSKALNLTAYAPREGAGWSSPRLQLEGAAYQRGYLLVDPGAQLAVRSETLADALRQGVAQAPGIRGLGAPAGLGRLYFHWGDAWGVRQRLAPVDLRRESEEQQALLVSPDHLALHGRFAVTAVGREMFDLGFGLPPASEGWEVESVRVNGGTDGFSYRVADDRLRVELVRPVRTESQAVVEVVLRRLPPGWERFSPGAEPTPGEAPLRVAFPLVRTEADKVTGTVSATAGGDLEVGGFVTGVGLVPVNVGKMSALGLGPGVRAAFRYEATPGGTVSAQVERRRPRLAARSVGLVSATVTGLAGTFEVNYTITRARARTLYLLTARELGREVGITVPGYRMTALETVAPGESTLVLPESAAARYQLWRIRLDNPVEGEVLVRASYADHPVRGRSEVPLVRPAGAAQSEEMLAIQAQEELALALYPAGAKVIDTLALPALPAPAERVLAAYQLNGLNGGAGGTGAGADAAIGLETTVHRPYDVPVAVAASGSLLTLVGADGSQQAQADFAVLNAGLQFLTFRLPEGAELWSAQVGGNPVKPGRDGDAYRLSLPRARRPLPVRVVYEVPGEGGARTLRLGGVELPGIEVNRFLWTVVPPPGVRVAAHRSALERTAPPRSPEPLLVRFIAADFAVGADEAASVAMSAQTVAAAAAEQAKPFQFNAQDEQQKATVGKARGRRTLPLSLKSPPSSGLAASFGGLEAAPLEVTFAPARRERAPFAIGFFAVLLKGLLLLRRRPFVRFSFVLGTAAAGTLGAAFFPGLTGFFDGAVAAAAALGLAYPGWAALRRIGAWTARRAGGLPRVQRLLRIVAHTACGVLVAALVLGPSPAEGAPPPPPGETGPDPLLVPYDGTAPAAGGTVDRVILPHADYVDLWNRAYPDQVMAAADEPVSVAVAGARYRATLEGEQLVIVFRGELEAAGRGTAVLPLPFAGSAVTAVELDGRPAKVHAAPGGDPSLLVEGGTRTQLTVRAVAAVTQTGRRGSVTLGLPPFAAAVLDVVLPGADLDLEVPASPGVVERLDGGGDAGGGGGETSTWRVPLGAAREVVLNWFPRAGTGAADRTLSADAAHQVYAFHWALVGVSDLSFRFSAGEHERFNFLLPEGSTLTALSGPNLRGHRQAGAVERDGARFDLYEVRLHRAAEKAYRLNLRWVADLPAAGAATPLRLPRAEGVGRESGSVALHAARGIEFKVAAVAGGRRVAQPAGTPATARPGLAEGTAALAAYRWPFRPFRLDYQMERAPAEAEVVLNQLVRISPDDVQLLARAEFTATAGDLFGAGFALPDGYSPLSVVGPEVEDWHVQDVEGGGRRLHFDFNAAVRRTSLAVVLVDDTARTGELAIPTLAAVAADGSVLPDQSGQLAVQVAPALEAQTSESRGLKAVAPSATRGWLDAAQAAAVRFAYTYARPGYALGLQVLRRPAKVRVEIVAGIAVEETSAWYAYRLRYHIDGSPVDRLSFTLPERYADLVAVGSPSLRSVSHGPSGQGDGRHRWEVAMVNELTDDVDVTINFALPIDEATRRLPVPRVETEAPSGYRAIVAVQNLSRHQVAAEVSESLQPLSLRDQRQLLDESVRRSLQSVYQSFEPGWDAALAVTAQRRAQRVQAVVDLMALETVVDRAGRCRYQATLSLLNRSEQFLRVRLPEGAELWAARVDGQAVRPVLPAGGMGAAGGAGAGAGRGEVLIPLVKTSLGGLPYEVKLLFSGQLAALPDGGGRISPPAPKIIGVPVERTTWALFLPEGFTYDDLEGNVSAIAGTAEALDIGIDTVLSQLGRYALSSVASGKPSEKGKEVYSSNWSLLNKKLSSEIAQAEQLLEANPAQLDQGQIDRFRGKLEQQRRAQKELDVLFEFNQTAAATAGDNNLNFLLNGTATCTGIDEVSRNGVFFELPTFVLQAERAQLGNIQSQIAGNDMAINNTVLPNFGANPAALLDNAPPAQFANNGGIGFIDQLGIAPSNLLGGEGDNRRSPDELLALPAIANDQSAQFVARNTFLNQKIADLGDNRLNRRFNNPNRAPQQQQQRLQQQESAPVQQAETQPQEQAAAAARSPSSRPGAPRALGAAQFYPSAAPATRAAEPPPPAPPHFVPSGTYSLPLDLPQAGRRLDFAFPGPDPVISLRATPAQRRPLAAPAGITLACLALIGAAAALGRRGAAAAARPPRRVSWSGR